MSRLAVRRVLIAGGITFLGVGGLAAAQDRNGPTPYEKAWPSAVSAAPAVRAKEGTTQPPAGKVSPSGGRAWAPAIAGLTGYSHPAVGATHCRLINSGRRDCVIPAKTNGAYVIRATGRSMAMGARPRQQLTIIVANRNCAQVINFKAWSGSTRPITASCEVSVLSDMPVLVSVVYADSQALKEASGPDVVFEPVRWSGVVEMRDVTPASN